MNRPDCNVVNNVARRDHLEAEPSTRHHSTDSEQSRRPHLRCNSLSSDTSPTLQDRLSLSSHNSGATLMTLLDTGQNLQSPCQLQRQQPYLFKTATGTLALADISMAPSESSLLLLSRHLADQSNCVKSRCDIDYPPQVAPDASDAPPRHWTPPPSTVRSNEEPVPSLSDTSLAPSFHSLPPRTQSVFLPPLAATPTLTPSAQSLSGLALHGSSAQSSSSPEPIATQRNTVARAHPPPAPPARRLSSRKRTRRQFSDQIVVADALDQLDELEEDDYRDKDVTFVPSTNSKKGKGKATAPARVPSSTKSQNPTDRDTALERNRQAAVRARQKRKNKTEELERSVEDLLAANSALQLTAHALLGEAHQLRNLVLASHASPACQCPHVHSVRTRGAPGGDNGGGGGLNSTETAMGRALARPFSDYKADRSFVAPAIASPVHESNMNPPRSPRAHGPAEVKLDKRDVPDERPAAAALSSPIRDKDTAIEMWRNQVGFETNQLLESLSSRHAHVVDELEAIPIKRTKT